MRFSVQVAVTDLPRNSAGAIWADAGPGSAMPDIADATTSAARQFRIFQFLPICRIR
jgi:hypothetical protein